MYYYTKPYTTTRFRVSTNPEEVLNDPVKSTKKIKQNKRPWFKKLADWCRKRGKYVVIMDRESKEPYLERFYLHPRWLTLGLFRIVIHRFWKSDDDDAFHSHPWLFWGSKLLEGEYVEHTPDGSFRRKPGKMRFYSGWALHQIELDKRRDGKDRTVWTLFFMGLKIRDWGFAKHKGDKEIHWETYLKSKLEAAKTKSATK